MGSTPSWRLFLLMLSSSLASLAGDSLLVSTFDVHRADRELLRSMGIEATPESLVELLLPQSTEGSLQRLVEDQLARLDAPSWTERRRAFAALLQGGRPALELARQRTPPRSAEARAFLMIIEEKLDGTGSARSSAIRLLVQLDPARARTVLSKLLPRLITRDEIHECVRGLHETEFEKDPGFWELVDKVEGPGRAALLETARKAGGSIASGTESFLTDAAPEVRLQAALLLLHQEPSMSLAVLIDLLQEESIPLRLVAEDQLFRNTTARIPSQVYGNAIERKLYAQKWRDWLEAGGRLRPRDQPWGRLKKGQSLIADFMGGRVFLLQGRDEIVWQIDGIRGACHARLLANGNVLVAAAHERAVFEADPRSGERVWSYLPNLAFAGDMVGCAERMPNGNTMVLIDGWQSKRSQILEVSPEGKIVRSLGYSATNHPRNAGDMAHRQYKIVKVDDVDLLPDGQLLVCDAGSERVSIVDWDGRVSWAVSIPDAREADLLPNGNVLISQGTEPRVIEVDREGKIVWAYRGSLVQPHEADRLDNGNTTICDAEGDAIIEVNPEGRVVWSFRDVDHPDDIDRRLDFD